MNRCFSILLAACLAQSVQSRADDLAIEPRQGALLLANGELIEGTITLAGDRFDVVGDDYELRIRRGDVVFLGRDRLECYRHQRSGIEVGRVGDHLTLAEWCLKHGLLEAAETELAAARAADPDHPRIRLLEPRFELARKAPPAKASAAPRDATPASQQLDALARSLPEGTMERFANGIQPMLLNYCAKSGCHGPRAAGTLRLERIGVQRLSGRHATQANLRAVLTAIDRDHPQDSKLLTAPIRPHGNLKSPVFTDREQVQYKQLVEWVYLLSRAAPAAEPPADDARAESLLQVVEGQPPLRPGAAEPRQTSAAGAGTLPGDDWARSFPDQARSHPDTARQGAPRRQAAPAEPASGQPPRDPFDPEVFNRRFHGR